MAVLRLVGQQGGEETGDLESVLDVVEIVEDEHEPLGNGGDHLVDQRAGDAQDVLSQGDAGL